GLGDTIRVSLTEDSVYESPVAPALADKVMSLWQLSPPAGDENSDGVDPFTYTRRNTSPLELSATCHVGPAQPPRVIVKLASPTHLADAARQLSAPHLKDTPVEGLLVRADTPSDLAELAAAVRATQLPIEFLALEIGPLLNAADLTPLLVDDGGRLLIVRKFQAGDADMLREFANLVRTRGHFLAIDASAATVTALAPALRDLGETHLVFTQSDATGSGHAAGAYRRLRANLRALGFAAPVWIRNTAATAVHAAPDFLSKLLEASLLTGSSLCDGLGDLVSIETETDLVRATKLTYNVLQGAGARSSKTEFVACPSCGRTLFDLQTTTQRIRAQTGHLKGVKIAIMGCIVNGPGEMADADFGYVGGAPGKINLYVGKTCVQYNIPQVEADARLVALIREHGKWIEPAPHHTL
ncbi:MAG: flavodoxin-dependent (E)-4-hydroxy-3-methylbut-2-enyl-diphosphate synthase, partial [Candidatus Didemnitutus sp.]|nr:flavodoxin-dependent (E)-4-hydroxy-3-methylbut-2-enyl-diphosphate synthase [Candidatus Didemnitutus sp.]